MKKTILITYHLRGDEKLKKKLIGDFIKQAPGWWHYVDTTWLVRTNESVRHWSYALGEIIDEGDRLLVLEIDIAEAEGWLPSRSWKWIRNVIAKTNGAGEAGAEDSGLGDE